MDFVFANNQPNKLVHDVRLIEKETQKVFYDKLCFLFIEIKKFDKNLEDCQSRFDKWLYLLKNLSKLDHIPAAFQEKVFKKLFQVAALAEYDPKQLQSYRDSEKNYLDFTASINTSFREGKTEGKIEIARNMKDEGFTIAQIVKVTGLSEQEIVKASY
jgi:predicted transposase/invertase (TIGR01784 family)